MVRQAERQRLDAHALLRIGRGTHFDGRHDGGHIGQRQCADAAPQRGVGAVARIHQHDTARHARRERRTHLRERDLRLGLERDLRGNMRPVAAPGIVGPCLRQIQPIGDRQAAVTIGDRQRHRHLAIGLFAELPAILMVHADRVAALLGESRIVDDPRLDRSVTLERRHHHRAHLGQYALVRPRCAGNEMQKLLMLRRNCCRRRYRRHRLNALATLRRQKPCAIIPQRRRPIRMTDHARQFLHKSCKAIGSARYRFETHRGPPP